MKSKHIFITIVASIIVIIMFVLCFVSEGQTVTDTNKIQPRYYPNSNENNISSDNEQQTHIVVTEHKQPQSKRERKQEIKKQDKQQEESEDNSKLKEICVSVIRLAGLIFIATILCLSPIK